MPMKNIDKDMLSEELTVKGLREGVILTPLRLLLDNFKIKGFSTKF